MATGTIVNTNYANISTNNRLLLNVDISSNTSSNPYIAPHDGYVLAEANSSGYGKVDLYNSSITLTITPSTWGNIFVKKGTAISPVINISQAYFRVYW